MPPPAVRELKGYSSELEQRQGINISHTQLIHPLGAQLADINQLALISKCSCYSLAESGTLMRPWSLVVANWHPYAGCISSKSTCGEWGKHIGAFKLKSYRLAVGSLHP